MCKGNKKKKALCRIKEIFKIVIPSALMLVSVYFMRGGKDILCGLYFVFPLMYIAMGLIYADFIREWLVGVTLISIAFIVPINLWFKMGSCIDSVLIYATLSCVSFFIKRLVKKKRKGI